MCPNCIRGLTIATNELCSTCAGTGIWNPLSAKDVSMDNESIAAPATDNPVTEEVVTNEAPIDATTAFVDDGGVQAVVPEEPQEIVA